MQQDPLTYIRERLTLLLGVFALAVFCSVATPISAQNAEGEGSGEEAGVSLPEGLQSFDLEIEEFELRLLPLTSEELSALAAVWLGIAREKTDQVVEATIASQKKPDGPSQDDVDQIVDLTQQRNEGFARFSAVVSGLEKKGGDEAEVAGYRAYRNAIIVEEKQRASFRTLVSQAVEWVTDADGGVEVARNVGVVIAAVFGLFILARIIRAYARRLFRRVPNLSKLLQSFLAMVIYWFTIAFGLMFVLAALGVDITPLFALVGGASFVLAFAMQDTLGNLASGLMIMLNHPFDEGDYIAAGGTSGTVKKVSIVSTTIVTPDNQIIVVPNSMVWGDVIVNSTASELRRVDLLFGIDYADDPDKAIDVILEVARKDERVLSDPEPWVRVTNLGESSVDLTARLWCKSEDFWELKFALTKDVKTAFDAAGISIPYPHSVEISKAG